MASRHPSYGDRSDVTEREGRDDCDDERLLVELACLGSSSHASVPENLPRPLSRFIRGGIRIRFTGPLSDGLCGLVRNPCPRSGRRRNGPNSVLTGLWRWTPKPLANRLGSNRV